MAEAEITIGRGDNKRKVPVSKASERDLQWYASECKNQSLKNAAQAELKRRGNAPAPAAQQSQAIARAQQPTTALAKTGAMSLEKAIHDPQQVNARLSEMAENFHLVTPVTSVDALPPGCGISISYVTVDPNPDPYDGPKEVYDVGGRLGLSGDTLKRIAAAAGIDWDPRQSGRLDDGSDPHYAHYRAVGFVRSFDGSLRTVTGEVEIDAREGSPQLDEIREKAAKRAAKTKKPNDGGESQIRELRKFLIRHAESKAKNRAIADMGVKRSYAPDELKKPFAVARIVWTGQTDDPELKREFARMHGERMMDGAAALYGRQPPALPQARTAPAPHFTGHGPPPVGSVDDDPNDYGGYDYDAAGEEHKSSPQAAPAPQQAQAPQQPPAGAGDAYEGPDAERY